MSNLKQTVDRLINFAESNCQQIAHPKLNQLASDVYLEISEVLQTLGEYGELMTPAPHSVWKSTVASVKYRVWMVTDAPAPQVIYERVTDGHRFSAGITEWNSTMRRSE